MLYLSRYLQVLRKKDVVAVFHSLKPSPVFFDIQEWNKYLQIKNNINIEEHLKKKDLLVSPEEDKAILKQMKREQLSPEAPSILYLLLTRDCNFRCQYCFQPERQSGHLYKSKQKPFMSRQVAQKGIDLFTKHIQEKGLEREAQVQFYGGEPLLNIDVFKFAIDYLEHYQRNDILPESLTKTVVTNGSLMTRKLANFLAQHNINVGLSLDGKKPQNDVFRKTKSGKSAYELAARALRLLQQAQAPVTLSVTITPVTAPSLLEIAKWAKEEMGVGAIGFNIVGGKSYEYFKSSFSRKEYGNLVADGLVEVFKYGREVGLYEDRIMRKVEAFVDGYFYATDCGAIRNQFTIQPDGQVTFCHVSSEYSIGNVFHPDLIDFENPILKKWEERIPLNNPHCQNCFAISICGGGCYHNIEELGGYQKGENAIDPNFCRHTRETMEFLIWDLLEQAEEGLSQIT